MTEKRRQRAMPGFVNLSAEEEAYPSCQRGTQAENYAHDYEAITLEDVPPMKMCHRCGRVEELVVTVE